MRNKITTRQHNDIGLQNNLVSVPGISNLPGISYIKKTNFVRNNANNQAEILFISSYPPRVCGIATYSQDLIKALNNKFNNSLSFKVCALEEGDTDYQYPDEVKFVLKTSLASSYKKLVLDINKDTNIKIVLIQHEFGFFNLQEKVFLQTLNSIIKPVIIVFHTVLPDPDKQLKLKIESIAAACESIIVMTHNSAEILHNDYGIARQRIIEIAHGTHLVPHLGKDLLKKKYGLRGRRVLTTFGLLSSGKNIETTLEALPTIVKTNPDVVFLIIGKTHPEVVKRDGEIYRQKLESLVILNKLASHVVFVNNYLPLSDLLEYLQLTDIYLFTSNDPQQAVSGTFVYAMSCGCPIISTPIPHAREVLTPDTGIIFDFQSSQQLADEVIRLLNDEPLRKNISTNTLQKIVSTAWENSAVAHARLFESVSNNKISIRFDLPAINLDHMEQMTTGTGIIQFSKINQPDICSGYTLDDNARALIVMCMNYKLTGNEKWVSYIDKYLQFIKFCQQPGGTFLNYVDKDKNFTDQNKAVNLDDSNGRAVWALGYLISANRFLPDEIVSEAEAALQKVIPCLESLYSTRGMAFAIKGLYLYYKTVRSPESLSLIIKLANRLVQMYKHESVEKWSWFESYLTYANSILPEALLYTWLLTGENIYNEIAKSSFSFLISLTFNENGIEVISNKSWLKRGQEPGHFGEQPIDVAYTVMTLGSFYNVFGDEDYRLKMETAFNWFLGNNRLHQIIYNPCTGGCYDGLEESHVNLNQGAESTVSYLMARLTLEKYKDEKYDIKRKGQYFPDSSVFPDSLKAGFNS